jgi:hypothetical protein
MLHLNVNDLTDAALEALAGLGNLEWLNLDHARVTDNGLRYLSGLAKVRWLDLGNTRVTDAGLPYLLQLSELEHLNLSGTVGLPDGSAPHGCGVGAPAEPWRYHAIRLRSPIPSSAAANRVEASGCAPCGAVSFGDSLHGRVCTPRPLVCATAGRGPDRRRPA